MEENEQSTVVQSQKKGFGIAGLVLGILSILCCMCMGAGLIFCIIGGIFSMTNVHALSLRLPRTLPSFFLMISPP